ncbi:hypothetical protein D3C78_1617370 [compost metagenome]
MYRGRFQALRFPSKCFESLYTFQRQYGLAMLCCHRITYTFFEVPSLFARPLEQPYLLPEPDDRN